VGINFRDLKENAYIS